MLNRVEISPGLLLTNHLSLAESDNRIGKGMVVGVTHNARRWFDSGFAKPLAVSNRQMLHATVAIVRQALLFGTVLVQGLLKRIENKIGSWRTRGALAGC